MSTTVAWSQGMSELELGTVLLHKYRIDGLRVASRDVHVYDATDTLHERHVSIKVFERASPLASEEHEGPVIDMGVVEGGAMYFVESDSPMHRTAPPPPLVRKPVANTKSEPRAVPGPFGRLKWRRPSKPPSTPPPPLPKVVVEQDIDVEIEIEEHVDDEVTIDCRRAELEVEIPIDFAKAVRAPTKRAWWIAAIAAAAVIAAGVAWGAQRVPSNAAPTETKTIAPTVLEPTIAAPPPRPATTIETPAVAKPPPAASTSERRHDRRHVGRDPLTI